MARRSRRQVSGSSGSAASKQTQTLNLAYDAWQADRLDDARRGYEQVLRRRPQECRRPARSGGDCRPPGAARACAGLYLQVLESDPGDVTAQAALINMRGQSDARPVREPSEDLARQPARLVALVFALGNLYAGQSRWSEAQQAYFQAYALEPDNADHLFNVAVSLDHLRQKKLAAQYYRMALSAAETSASAFDKNAASKRILELQP
jgi:tetratricopeptide (TPR) repeat protein